MYCPTCGAALADGTTTCSACHPTATGTATAAAPAASISTVPGERPLGLTILSILNGIGAAAMALFALLAFTMGTALGSTLGGTGMMFGSLLGGMIGVFFLAFAALSGFLAWGLWNGVKAAWILEIIFQGLGILFGLTSLMAMDLSAIVGLAISGVIMWYLLRPHVKAYFEK